MPKLYNFKDLQRRTFFRGIEKGKSDFESNKNYRASLRREQYTLEDEFCEGYHIGYYGDQHKNEDRK